MSKRDRDASPPHLIAFAIIVLLIGVTATWAGTASIDYFSQKQREEHQATDQYAHYSRAEEICRVIDTATARLTCLAERIDAEQERQATIADLSAQSDMAKWTFAMLWVGMVGLIVSVVGIFVIYETLRESRKAAVYAFQALEQARRQAGIAEKQFLREQKPYLRVRVPYAEIKIDLDKARGDENPSWPFDANIVVRNVGRVPALIVAESISVGYEHDINERERDLRFLEAELELPPQAGSERSFSSPYCVHGWRQYERLAQGERLILWGHFIYEDIAGERWRQSFAFACKYNLPGVSRWGGESYNYDRKQRGDEAAN
ncbi:hypothetical protein [Maricaulis sp.]|uniref:hypothetical protein n=1 Tax=Maricaulis sp. TaxID=1486257 RepID=UPI003A91A7EE